MAGIVPVEPLDDSALIHACLNGRPDSFGLLVERYQDTVFGVVSRMISDREAMRDLAQETFLRAYRGLGSFKGDSTFRTWLLRIAINLCNTERRRIRTRRRLGGIARGRPADPDDPDHEIPDARSTPLDRIEDRERKELVLAAVDRLAAGSRDIVVLRDFQGLSYQEIAEILECPIGTVRSRLFRARFELRGLLEKALGGTD